MGVHSVNSAIELLICRASFYSALAQHARWFPAEMLHGLHVVGVLVVVILLQLLAMLQT